MGQGNLKQLTKEDYYLWGSMYADGISENGSWVSYRIDYESGRDTLFVKGIEKHKVFSFAKAVNGKFCEDKLFACMIGDTLVIQDLVSGTRQFTAGVAEYAFSGNGNYLILLLKEPENKKQLVVKAMDGTLRNSVMDVSSWKIDTDGNRLLCATLSEDNEAGVFVLSLGAKVKKLDLITGTVGAFEKLTWEKDGQSVGFILTGAGAGKVYCYRFYDMKLQVFDPKLRTDFPAGMAVGNAQHTHLHLSGGGQRVLFTLAEPEAVATKTIQVEVWNTFDKVLYPYREALGNPLLYEKAAVWWPETGRFFQICNREFPQYFLTADCQFAVVFNQWQNEPQPKRTGDCDYFLMDLETGEKDLLLKRHPGGIGNIVMSPEGRYVCYPKEKRWWVYDVKSRKHFPLGSDLKYAELTDTEIDGATSFGIAGWTVHDASMLIHDAYDLWQVFPDGKPSRRLTHGRENEVCYRILARNTQEQFDVAKSISGAFDLSKGLWLKASNIAQGFNGLFEWGRGRHEKPLVWANKRIDSFAGTNSSNRFLYVEQRYDLSPVLKVFDRNKEKSLPVFESNPQQKYYGWGTVENVAYTVKGKLLKGILIYPAGFAPSRKYPMIVSVYEKQLKYQHDYINPAFRNPEGFNITNFVTDGYFVLLPDIVYEKGEVGESSAACVLAAVEAALKCGSIDRQKLGLIGHSFGGFETDFIISKTSLFAAAVSGSAWTDFVSAYLSVSPGFLLPEYFRAEFQQQRMGRSLFDDPELYFKNSPVLQAEKVNTPLLSWVGKDDKHIRYEQSVEFYLALRRLRKKHTLLIYPQETHWINNRENQKDLTLRIEQWFAYFLKNEGKPDWLEPL